MHIDATVGGRRFGGYTTYSFQTQVEEFEGEALVTFRLDNANQEMGSFRVGKSAAKWLAYALLATSEGFSPDGAMEAKFAGDDLQEKPEE